MLPHPGPPAAPLLRLWSSQPWASGPGSGLVLVGSRLHEVQSSLELRADARLRVAYHGCSDGVPYSHTNDSRHAVSMTADVVGTPQGNKCRYDVIPTTVRYLSQLPAQHESSAALIALAGSM